MITAVALRQEIENLERQKRQALDTVQQCLGALALAYALLEQVDDKGMSPGEFAEMIGGNGATAEIIPNE